MFGSWCPPHHPSQNRITKFTHNTPPPPHTRVLTHRHTGNTRQSAACFCCVVIQHQPGKKNPTLIPLPSSRLFPVRSVDANISHVLPSSAIHTIYLSLFATLVGFFYIYILFVLFFLSPHVESHKKKGRICQKKNTTNTKGNKMSYSFRSCPCKKCPPPLNFLPPPPPQPSSILTWLSNVCSPFPPSLLRLRADSKHICTHFCSPALTPPPPPLFASVPIRAR